MAAIPYHLLKVCGNIVFAARGSDIHSFNSALEHISTWNYPLKQENAPTEPVAQGSPAPDGPPTKRRKLEDGQEPSANGQGKSKNGAQENPPTERPFVQGLYTTTDGHHLVAITGSDKTIWVFEHDGAGNLKQLSQRQVSCPSFPLSSQILTPPRTMPKRPCALALTKDSRSILSADKFGDVYALPLLPSPSYYSSSSDQPQSQPQSSLPSTPTPQRSASSTPIPIPFKPQANEFTVHTKRNLKALENQKLSLTTRQQQQAESRPQFEHTLLLGHVSMLTAICVGTSTVSDEKGSTREREYILTADRDEHIRVSRGYPSGQAHVIEGFCLGHEDFVSRLCMAPGGREEVLVSGGGDDDLLVWDWVKGKLLSSAGVLEQVKKVAGMEEAGKVAVTRVVSWRWEDKRVVGVVCERYVTLSLMSFGSRRPTDWFSVPALFFYDLLDDNTLRHRETIELPGNALDVETIESSGPSPRLLVAVDCSASNEGESSSLIVLEKEDAAEAGWKQSNVQNLLAAGDIKLSVEELQKILYTTESLRKLTDFD